MKFRRPAIWISDSKCAVVANSAWRAATGYFHPLPSVYRRDFYDGLMTAARALDSLGPLGVMTYAGVATLVGAGIVLAFGGRVIGQ